MGIPDHTQATLDNYLVRGWEPGGFVMAMLAMDMERALYTADIVNRHVMWGIGCWIIEYAPEGSWGSYETVQDWIADRDGRRSRYAKVLEQERIMQTLKEGAE